MTAIFIFRQDLRISDNPALLAALEHEKILPIYIFDTKHQIGRASMVWLHHSLQSLNDDFGGAINFYCGDYQEILLDIIARNKVDMLYYNRCYEPLRIKEDGHIRSLLKSQKIEVKSFNASLLWEPWEILKEDKSYYKVFTAFYRVCVASLMQPRVPMPKPNLDNKNFIKDKKSIELNELNLLPKKNWHKKMMQNWQCGEAAAAKRLQHFLNHGIKNYKEGRNHPSLKNVSRLSPYLHFGEISPNQVWHAVMKDTKKHNIKNSDKSLKIKNLDYDTDHFLSELGWREFSYYLLYHFADLPKKNFQRKFDDFVWQDNSQLLKLWQRGLTGYPIVDAGMRELWQTGYMHNRVRMIVASFLVKNLLLHWRYGERWFFNCLVDADLANNSAAWQWVAGSGADAAPYFRIFNPILQGEKFDPHGQYSLQYVPELKNLPKKYLFKPWLAPAEVLQEAKIILGKTYPKPIVDIDDSRQMALLAYKNLK